MSSDSINTNLNSKISSELLELLDAPEILPNGAFINGSWCDADDGSVFDVCNPGSGEVIATVPKMGAQETSRAIQAAEDSFKEWEAVGPRVRSKILKKWYDLVIENKDDLARIIMLENGKPYAEALGEVTYGANFIEWYSEEAKRAYGRMIPDADRLMFVIKSPIGVSVGIAPWNFPLAMVTREAAPSLAAGCPFIMKPAEQTPLSGMALAYLAKKAGVPAGVFSVVSGDPASIGGEMTSNPIVKKLGFTGSNATGKLLAHQCADSMKKVSLELGGSSPFIVFEDADIELAIDALMLAKYRNAGQVCVAATRVLVQSSIYDDFMQRFSSRVKQLKLGHSSKDKSVTMGPLINEAGFNKVKTYVEDAVSKGAKVILGGKPHALGGNFYEPTILSGIKDNMLVAENEIFGPVACFYSFDNETEAVDIANGTPYGLLAYFFTKDTYRAWRLSKSLDFGIVGMNTGYLGTDCAPLGGVKESGIGRVGGVEGLEEYMEPKFFAMNAIEPDLNSK